MAFAFDSQTRALKSFLVNLLIFVTAATAHAVHAQHERVWIPGWKQTNALTTPRAGAAILEHNGVIYALGGVDGKDFMNSTEWTRVKDNGELEPWRAGPALNEARGFTDAAQHGEFVYIVSGGNGPAGHNLLRSIERARILPSGELGPWERETQGLMLPRRCVKVFVMGNRLYASGGYSGTLLDTVESAAIGADGHLGAWRMESTKLTQARYVHGAKAFGSHAYMVGGHNQSQGAGLATVELTTVRADGNLGTWESTTPLHEGRYGHSVAHYRNFIYALGGLDGARYLRTIEKAALTDAGTVKAWNAAAPLAVARANFGVVVAKDRMYIVGGANQDGYFSAVEMANLNERGDTGYWGTKQDAHAYEKEQTHAAPVANAVTTDNAAVIAEVIDTERYTYLRVTTADGEEWLATGRGDFKTGQRVAFSAGVPMANFRSEALNRTFASIRFVSRVVPVP